MATPFGVYLRDKLIISGFGEAESFYGCSETEIEQLRADQKVNFLPETYRQFLLAMGVNCGSFWHDSAIRYGEMIGHKDAANWDFEHFDRPFRVPDDAFVFASQQGYVFYYFHTSERDDNPPIYMFGDDLEEPVKINDHLSEFYEQSIEEFRLGAWYSNTSNRIEVQDSLKNTIQPNWDEYFRSEARRDASLFSQLFVSFRTLLLKLGFRDQKR